LEIHVLEIKVLCLKVKMLESGVGEVY